jgi:hypothetical protein
MKPEVAAVVDDSIAASFTSDLIFPSLAACLFESPDRYAASAGLVPYLGSFAAEAFRAAQLISDEFVERLPLSCLSFLISTLGLFARQSHDMNVGLTAVGQLWKVSDHLASAREDRDKEREKGASGAASALETKRINSVRKGLTASGAAELGLAGHSGPPSHSPSASPILRRSLDHTSYDALWSQLFAQLLLLCNGSTVQQFPVPIGLTLTVNQEHPPAPSAETPAQARSGPLRSERPWVWRRGRVPAAKQEVRNAIVKALFESLATHGRAMPDALWCRIVRDQVRRQC